MRIVQDAYNEAINTATTLVSVNCKNAINLLVIHMQAHVRDTPTRPGALLIGT